MPDEIISKACEGDVWAGLDFSPVFLCWYTLSCFQMGFTPNCSVSLSQIIKTINTSIWLCAIQLSWRFIIVGNAFILTTLHGPYRPWAMLSRPRRDHQIQLHFSNKAGTHWTLNNEEFPAAIQLTTVSYCYIKTTVMGIIRRCKG